MTEIPKIRRQVAILRALVAVLFIALLSLAIAFAVYTGNLQEQLENVPPNYCTRSDDVIDLSAPDYLPPFYDLTDNEISNVKEFLYSDSDLNLVRASDIRCNLSYIYTMELHLPNKDLTLGYLDHGRAQPSREAKVLLFRGDKPESYVEEYVVGPLPQPTYKKDQKTFPFRYRPVTKPELDGAIKMLSREVNDKATKLIEESYGGRIINCDAKCLTFRLKSFMPSVVSGQPVSRKMWFWLTADVEHPALHPLDFSILVDMTSKYVEDFNIEQVYYGEERFTSIHELRTAYDDGSIVKTKIPYPVTDDNSYSISKQKSDSKLESQRPPPREFEFGGKRYTINGRHIKYLGWDMDLRMSTSSGPQLFDIKYHDERIVYELSLQEIAVLHSANDPSRRFADFIHSISLLGGQARSLVSGSDCPEHSTFIPATHVFENSDHPMTNDHAFCIFEHNTARPLRRHLESSGSNKFYGGMSNSVLTIRSIITINNFDNILDFIFHQNGAIQVSVSKSGYIVTSFRYPAEDEYGFRLRDHVTGNLQHHMFNFKVDLDIKDRQNRFETLEIVPTEVDNTLWSSTANAKYHQTKFYRNHIHTEQEAAMSYNFSTPKYLTFYSNKHKSKYGVPQAYRLLNRGMSKQLLPRGTGVEPSLTWSRYQFAVTKYKESEKKSSSVFANWDSENPVASLQTYIDDKENIVDEICAGYSNHHYLWNTSCNFGCQPWLRKSTSVSDIISGYHPQFPFPRMTHEVARNDQVVWVTMGAHHIPHTEDFPTTSTIGSDLDFFLVPYNYFDVDPAMGSGDWVRIEPRNQEDARQGVHIHRNNKDNYMCVPPKSAFDNNVQSNPSILFDT